MQELKINDIVRFITWGGIARVGGIVKIEQFMYSKTYWVLSGEYVYKIKKKDIFEIV